MSCGHGMPLELLLYLVDVCLMEVLETSLSSSGIAVNTQAPSFLSSPNTPLLAFF